MPANSSFKNSDHHNQLQQRALSMGMSKFALKGADIVHGGILNNKQ